MTLHAAYRPVRPQRPCHARKRATMRVRAGEKSCNQRLRLAAEKPQPRLHCSQQFSTVALTTSTATIAERYAYSAYGAPTVCNASGTDIGSSAKDNRITYTGREWDDELVLYHFRARLYDAGVGRFLGRDPIWEIYNIVEYYHFMCSSPLANADPSGLYDIYFGPEFDMGESVRVISSLARILNRIETLLSQIAQLESSFSSFCVARKFKLDLKVLNNLLECIKNNLLSNEPLLLNHHDLMRDSTGATGRWPFHLWPFLVHRIVLNDGVDPNWRNSNALLDEMLFHELSHHCGTHDEILRPTPNRCLGGLFMHAHELDGLMHTDLGEFLRVQIFRAELECNRDSKCEEIDRYYTLSEDMDNCEWARGNQIYPF